MSTFYFQNAPEFVLGTSPYYVQQVSVKKQENPLTAVPASMASGLDEKKVQYHDKEELPPLDVDLSGIKKSAAEKIVRVLNDRVPKPKTRKKKQT